ncbi:MAG: glycosyltransferase family 2 protein, partial [Stellaceae bacterium]
MASPLVTLLLMTYRQEPFVREAVRSALAQDYQPLQIIISDDASPDRTFEVIAEETHGYRGPHEVQIRRNAERRRSIRHMEEAVSLARGELVVTAHGDDVSVARRVTALVEAWRRERVSMVSSRVRIIDRNGGRSMAVNEDVPSRRIPPEEIVGEIWLTQMLGATLAM